MEKRRFSIAMTGKYTRRPEVFLWQAAMVEIGFYKGRPDGVCGEEMAQGIHDFQRSCNLKPDGLIGPITGDEIIRQASKFEPPLKRRILSLICVYELSTTQNAYGRATIIADGAGANYGVLQANRHGSCSAILRLGNATDLLKRYEKGDKFKIDEEIAKWFGSGRGIAAQNQYFDNLIWGLAKRILDALPVKDWDERSIYRQRLWALAVDSVVQNGAMFSPNNKPFWRTITPEEKGNPDFVELFTGKGWDSLLGTWIPFADMKAAWERLDKETGGKREETNKRLVLELWPKAPDPEAALSMLAQIRARTSRPDYWRFVEKRRMTDATGRGRVNGSDLDLVLDFGIGWVKPSLGDRDPERDKTIHKMGADLLRKVNLKPEEDEAPAAPEPPAAEAPKPASK